MRYSKGVSWIEDTRIPFVDEGDKTLNHNTQAGSFVGSFGSSETIYKENTKGRFTPNLLVCDDMLNDGSISKSNSGGISSGNNFGGLTQKYRDRKGVDDKGTNSRYYDLDKWFDKMVDGL